MSQSIRLGVNVDHVATLRQQRKEGDPNLLDITNIAIDAGADSITVHLREDRRHIQTQDVYDLKNANIKLNFECAVTEEMLSIATEILPYSCCLVPEKREELTTEGGLNLFLNPENIKRFINSLQLKNIIVSLFIDPDKKQIKKASELGADAIELHTGLYSRLSGLKQQKELNRIKEAALYAKSKGLKVFAGHGLTIHNIGHIVTINEIEEVNIGHSLVSLALINGMYESVKMMKNLLRR